MLALTNQHNLETGGYNILIYLPCLPCTTEVLMKFRKLMKFEHLYIATCFSQMYLSSIEKDH